MCQQISADGHKHCVGPQLREWVGQEMENFVHSLSNVSADGFGTANKHRINILELLVV